MLFLAAGLSMSHAQVETESPETAPPELAPGVRIERSRPSSETRIRLARLREWRDLYERRLRPLRRAVSSLFEELERSSLTTLRDRCRAVGEIVERTDRADLFSSTSVAVDRVVYGSLERFRTASVECLAGHSLKAYRLLVEARAGLQWVDRRVERALAPKVRLPGLAEPD